MPYGGHSAIGLIILLYEVAMPHTNDAAYDLSTPATISIVTGAQTPTAISTTDIFSLFSPSQKNGAKKERKNILHFSKSFYRTISFRKRLSRNRLF